MTTGDIAFAVAIVLMVACSLHFAPRIRAERIAMQWGFDLKPTWSLPKPIALWALIAAALFLRMLIFMFERYRPEWVHDVSLGLAIISVVIVACHFVILKIASGQSPRS